ncbi:MAG TPA: helix-turn-helix transcriptional regulator [Mycobacteriales bacterium]|nr:helix-turn-helix transcriptional regulator [Mycobacteriales bacterium]
MDHGTDDHATIGAAVRSARLRRGLSLAVVAEQIGHTHSWLSRVERGLLPLESRRDLAALAEALQVSPTDLTGQPYEIGISRDDSAVASIPAVRRALHETDSSARMDAGTLLAAEESLTRMRLGFDLPGLGKLIPTLIPALRSTIPHVDAEDRDRLQRVLFWSF